MSPSPENAKKPRQQQDDGGGGSKSSPTNSGRQLINWEYQMTLPTRPNGNVVGGHLKADVEVNVNVRSRRKSGEGQRPQQRRSEIKPPRWWRDAQRQQEKEQPAEKGTEDSKSKGPEKIQPPPQRCSQRQVQQYQPQSEKAADKKDSSSVLIVMDETKWQMDKNKAEQQQRSWDRAFRSTTSVSEDGDEPVVASIQLCVGDELMPTEFLVRALKPKSVDRHFARFQRRGLVLYYRLPDLTGRYRTVNAIPQHVPLMMACCVDRNNVRRRLPSVGSDSSSDFIPGSSPEAAAADTEIIDMVEIVHSEIRCFTRRVDSERGMDEEKLWFAVQVDLADGQTVVNKDQDRFLCFPCLRDLLEHHVQLLVHPKKRMMRRRRYKWNNKDEGTAV